MAKWVNEGRTNVGGIYLSTAAHHGSLYVGLYENTAEPAITAVLSDMTEQSGSGYARIEVEAGDWTEDGTTKGKFTNLQKVFTASGGDWGDQYGYFICNTVAGTGAQLIAVEDFSDGPYDIKDNHSVKVTPVVVISGSA